MADILASVSVVLGAEISGFKAAMAQARKELSGLVKFSEGLKDIGQSLTTYVTLPLAAFGAAAVAASAKVESMRKGLEAITLQELGKQGVTGVAAIGQAAQLTSERMQQLEQIAKQPGLGFEAAVQGDVRLRAVGISAEQSAKSIKAFANAIATTGGGKSEFDRVTVQLAQLSAKGKVLAQDLRPIIEAAPAVSGALQRLYGTVDSETISASLKKQGQSSSDFVRVLTDELGKLPQVSGGLKNAFENLSDTATLGLAKIGDSISKSLSLPAAFQKISDAISGLANGFSSLSFGAQKAIVVLASLVAATGPVLVAVGTLGAALPAITAGFATLGVTSLSALAPILPVAAAVAAAAYLIIDNWAAITAYFGPSGEGGSLFRLLAESVTDSVAQIGQALGQLGSTGSNNLGSMVSASGVIKALFRDLAVGARAFSDVAGGTIGAIAALFRGEFSEAAEQAQRAVLGLLDPLANVFGFTRKEAERSTASFVEFFRSVLPVGEALTDAALAAKFLGGNVEGVVRTTGLLAQLREELKQVREARELETNTADIAADTARIKSLEAQIAALEGTDKAAKKLRDAYAEVQKSFRDIANESAALGEQFKYLEARQAADQAGIKKLIDAGYSPFSSAVQKLVGDLKNLNVTLGDNEKLATRTAAGVADLFKTPEFKLKVPELDKLENTDPVLPDYGVMFGQAAAQIAAGSGGIQQEFSSFSQAQADFNTQTEQLLDAFPAQAFATLGQSIGEALGSGGDVLEAVGDALLKTLAQFLAEYGRLVLLKGAADIALGNVGQGVAELIAGAALTALGGFAGSQVSSSKASSSPKISTTPASTTRSFTPTVAPGAATSGPATYKHQVVITADGRALSGVLQLELDRQGRVLGAR